METVKETWLHTISIRRRRTLLFGILLAMLYAINTYIVRVAFVSGVSMYPTMEDGDILLVNQVKRVPSRGDIILINISAKSIPGNYIVKRVIAIEGDTVSIDYENNAVFVNDEILSEPYLNYNCEDPMIPPDNIIFVSYHVPAGTVFVMGDNRNNSNDSRNKSLGMIEKTDIAGTICLHISLSRHSSPIGCEQRSVTS